MTEPFSPPESVTDEFGNRHHVTDFLGRGGQGAVYRTRDPDYAVKFALQADGSLRETSAFREVIQKIRTLPLPEGVQLALPCAVLAGMDGYLMRLLSRMQAFTAFFPSEGGQELQVDFPEWMEGMDGESAEKLLVYLAAGSLRFRLHVLGRAAAILQRLHASGLVYGDVSPNNLFFEREEEGGGVWLIDADNLRIDSGNTRRGIHTPMFGAPEVVSGKEGCRPRSDVYAFCVVAYWMLTLQHPFLGAAAVGGDNWSQQSFLEEPQEDTDAAMRGDLPWVNDPDDTRNGAVEGLPPDLTFTPRLSAVFQQCFGPGRLHPEQRPDMGRIAVDLAAAADQTLTCPGCGMGYPVLSELTREGCPYCGHSRPARLTVKSIRPGRDGRDETAWIFVREWPGGGERSLEIPARVVEPFTMRGNHRPVLKLNQFGDVLELQRLEGSGMSTGAVWLHLPDREAPYPLRSGYLLDWLGDDTSFELEWHSGKTVRRVCFRFREGTV